MTTQAHTATALDHITAAEGDVIASHVLALVTRIVGSHHARCELWPDRMRRARRQRITCLACGCLCWPWEHCPGCAARHESERS